MATTLPPTIHDLYPHLTEAEAAEAESRLEQYLDLVRRIFERLESESHPQVGQLTPKVGTLSCTPPQSQSSQ